jgi:hypothetical protein
MICRSNCACAVLIDRWMHARMQGTNRRQPLPWVAEGRRRIGSKYTFGMFWGANQIALIGLEIWIPRIFVRIASSIIGN